MEARLAVIEKDRKIYCDLQQEITTIGRGQGCSLELDDRNLSRTHCQIERIEGGWQLRDLDSQNGTRVNDKPITKAILQPGDVIQIGRTAILFEQTDPTDAAHPTDPTSEADRKNLLKLQEIYRELTGELHTDVLLEKIMDSVIEITGAQRGFLVLLDGETMEFAVARNIDKADVDSQSFRISRSILREVARNGHPVLLDSAQDDTRFGLEESVVQLELVSVLCVPMTLKEATLGLIYLANDLGRAAFTAEQLTVLEAFAAQAAIAIGNARLYEELDDAKKTVERLNERLEEKVEHQSREIALIEKSLPKIALKYNYEQIIGAGPAMGQVFKLLDRVIETRLPILIQGESGTGKELVAKAIHYNGELKGKRFVGINCAALTASLLESELFGHMRGSFTGAVRDRQGLFKIADGGTIFLDEVGEMSLEMQTKFLRVLQEGEFLPVGSTTPVRVQVRVIAASNKSLAKRVGERLFREDLFYRLNVIPIDLPPLRDRKEDIPLLVDHFLEKIAKAEGQPKRTLDTKCLEALVHYDWPGNVRELENEITRLLALNKGTLQARSLSEHVKTGGFGLMKLADLEGRSLKEIAAVATATVEKEAILTALKACNYKKVKVARMLDISRPTLDAKIQSYNIDLDAARNRGPR